MSWISNYVRPKFRALVTRSDIPDDLWQKCPECGQMIFHRELDKALQVCTHCGHHMRIGPRERMRMLFDGGQFTPIDLPESIQDPLKFRDRKRYGERLREARSKTEEHDALVVAHGRMGGQPVVMAAFNFAFMGGSMGIAVGDGLLAAARLACEKQAPLITVPASGGARMQEGILSLMQLPRTTIAVQMVKEQGLPYLVLLTDPTTGGVSASFAMLGDLTLAEPGAVIGFAGQRVIEATVREQLPDGFQRAEYLRDHGMVDQVVDRRELRERLISLFTLLCKPTPEARIVPVSAEQLPVSQTRIAPDGARIDDGRPRPAASPGAAAAGAGTTPAAPAAAASKAETPGGPGKTDARADGKADGKADAKSGERRSGWTLGLSVSGVTGRSKAGRDKGDGKVEAGEKSEKSEKSAKAEKGPREKSAKEQPAAQGTPAETDDTSGKPAASTGGGDGGRAAADSGGAPARETAGGADTARGKTAKPASGPAGETGGAADESGAPEPTPPSRRAAE